MAPALLSSAIPQSRHPRALHRKWASQAVVMLAVLVAALVTCIPVAAAREFPSNLDPDTRQPMALFLSGLNDMMEHFASKSRAVEVIQSGAALVTAVVAVMNCAWAVYIGLRQIEIVHRGTAEGNALEETVDHQQEILPSPPPLNESPSMAEVSCDLSASETGV